MNERLLQFIQYKTRGKQAEFASLMGWSPQYLHKMLKEGGIGIRPIVALLEKCSELEGKPCRYKRVKNAVKAACAGIEDARVELYDSGQLVVYDARDDSHKGIDLYPSRYDVASGDELFCACYLENYISDNDGIRGMLADILGPDEVREMVTVFDDKLRDVCDKIGAAHDAARQLADTYKAIGLGQDVEAASKRAVY